MELAVCTARVVPAGIVAAFKDETAKHAQHVAIKPMILFVIIVVFRKMMLVCPENSAYELGIIREFCTVARLLRLAWFASAG